jgi:UDP-N-acetylglucosamine 1-carboxyvinyltransferase
MTQGRTEIEDIEHIERGYEMIVEKLCALGADVQKILVPDHVLAKAQ